MEAYQTFTGRRQDLEEPLIGINPYLGAIGAQILPVNEVSGKTGTLYYAAVTADSSAESGLAGGTAPTAVSVTENSTTFTTVRKNKRYKIPRDSVKVMGGIASADKIGSRAALRSVMQAHETAVAAAVLANASATVYDIEASLIAAAQVGLKAIKRYPGKKAFVCSQTIFNRIMRFSEVTGRFGLSSAAVSGADALSIVAREPAALKLLLRAIIGVDEVLIGDDDIWYDGSQVYQDRAALVALPDPMAFSEIEQPSFGKTYTYLPDGQSYPFYIESVYDAASTQSNLYDAELWLDAKVLNAGALYILDGIDESNTIVTSAATTTTTTTTTTTGS
jgi:hypothetical protein